ncbi:unnamed protein product [Chrysodeixis includens]|uniref:U-box domain-containing protein n=1 Tax=Chrysodeixis includens TaxID=689277 RepID=A0A9P0FT60_CHRIL|nr:unnamed protein product [Chrysodeixis includens]
MEELQEPTLLQSVRAHRSEVTCVDACGARLVTGGGDRALRLWRWLSGSGWDEVARAASAHRYGVTAARWAGGGALLASGGVDGAVRVWCGRALAARRLLAAPGAAAVRALCWPGRARLLAGHDDGALCVWHVQHGQLIARLHAHEGALHAVAAPACGLLLLTACTNGVLKVFDLAEVCRSGTGGLVSPAPLTWIDNAHDLGALCADATEDGRLVATGGQDAAVRVWRAAGGLAECGPPLEGHAAAVTALRWGGGGALLASASLDRTARLWAPLASACLHVVHAHSRYLTCVMLSHDLSYLVTGSNDKTVRMWSLGSLTIDDDLETPCAALTHFALGDLEGIGPVEGDDSLEDINELVPSPGEEEGEAEGSGSRCVWRSVVHAGAINCVTTHEDLVATASSDGTARVFRWNAEAGELEALHELRAHQYPCMAADFGAAGAMLLTAGLDARACLWDVEMGVQLRSLSAPAGGGEAGEAGGGGVRGARVSTQAPPLLLLASDDGVALVWSLATQDPRPWHVYAGHSEGVTCCAWSTDGRVAATGAASGELRLSAPPPAPRLLHHEPVAHDLGVQSCDFAPAQSALDMPDETYLLATAGCDSLIKLWVIECKEAELEEQGARVRLVNSVAAHGGGASCVRWGGSAEGGALLGSAGADRWARVWLASAGGAVLRLLAAVPAAGAGGALSVALLAAPPLLLVGSLAGELAAWHLPPEPDQSDEFSDDEEATAPPFWSHIGVARWLRENITRAPGSRMSRDAEAELLQRAQDAGVTGARLLTGDVDDLLIGFGYGPELNEEEVAESKSVAEREEVRAQLRDELQWLRRPPPAPSIERAAPHWLLCPVSHRLLREPARAADGYTYERGTALDCFLAEGAVSPVSGRRLRNARLLPNYAVRAQLRLYLLQAPV